MSKLTAFASMLGKPRASSTRVAARTENDDTPADDAVDERKQRDGESDEDYRKRMDELDDKEKKDKDDEAARKAKAKAEAEKSAGDDDDEKSEKKAKAAAARERARCAAIVAEGINCGAIRQACAYAFDTEMSVETAKATLSATLADREDGKRGQDVGLYAAMSTQRQTPVEDLPEDPRASMTAVQATVAAAKAAMDKAQGKVPGKGGGA